MRQRKSRRGVLWDRGESGADPVAIATASVNDERRGGLYWFTVEQAGCEGVKGLRLETFHANLERHVCKKA